MNRKHLSMRNLSVLWVLLLVGVGAYWHVNQQETSPPLSLEGARTRVEAAGFVIPVNPHPGDPRAFVGAVTVSRQPMTWDEDLELVLGSSKEKWCGKARIHYMFDLDLDSMKPGLTMMRWGPHLVVGGDPEVVNEIIKLPAVAGESKVQKKP